MMNQTHYIGRCRHKTALALLALCAALVASAAPAAQRAKIEAVQGAVISSELSGRIASLPYRPGDAFDKGATLAEIDCALYTAERDRVSAKLQSARRTLDNKRRLAELHSVGKLDVDLAELAVREASAERRVASTNVSRCEVDAPFAGRVVRRQASEGQSVKAQQEVLEIVGRELEARIIVPARWLAWLEKGQRVTLAVEETGEKVSAKLTRIGAAVDPVSHTVPVWASLSESTSLRPGMSGEANFPDQPDNADNE